jgi:hypothetical protein
MSNQDESWVEDALRTLAVDDQHVAAPASVETAVMRAWDAEHAAVASHRSSRLAARRVALLVGAAAAVVVAATWLQREPASAPREISPLAELGYVLVPDPLADPESLHVVRLRMRRAGLASLGVPLVNPDADGLVEVELLVGEDGVARSIRRTALVTTSATETGGQR